MFLQGHNITFPDRERIQGYRLPWQGQAVSTRSRRQRPQHAIHLSYSHMLGQGRLDPRTFPVHLPSFGTSPLLQENVTSVILTGGASRTPMIQQAVKNTIGENKVAVNVNADEAAVLGAGLHGASLSRQFKTKDIKVSDVYVYDIQASYPTEPKERGSSKTITSTIFPPSSKTGSKKALTFKRKDDFSIKLSYKKTPFVCVLATRVVTSSLTGFSIQRPSSGNCRGQNWRCRRSHCRPDRERCCRACD